MTCIVAIKDKSGIIMGGDSLVSHPDNTIGILQTPKVKKINDFVFGGCGDFKAVQLLTYTKDLEKYSVSKKTDIASYLATVFVSFIQKELDGADFNFILGYKKRLFEISKDFSVIEHRGNYWCCGCGREAALGALFVLDKNTTLDNKSKIKKALEAAAKYSNNVRPPFTFVDNLPPAKIGTI